MEALNSDIVAIESYFAGLVAEDPGLQSFVLETSNDPFEMERFNAVSRQDDFAYPALVLFMPVITGDDNSMHNFEASQEMAYAILDATDDSHEQKLEKHRDGQLAAWRILKALRRDSKAGKFRMDRMGYKLAPFEYGNDNCVGHYCVVTLITSTNALIGRDD
jgi:hypothetical protein